MILAGIAAATQPETFTLQDVQPDILRKSNADLSGLILDNKWIVTLAGDITSLKYESLIIILYDNINFFLVKFSGDLAEVALIQAPNGDKISVGATGNWNSTALPRWYFLSSNDKLEITTAEIRGDLDGLILSNEINKWYSKIPNLKLSQIFDMYFSKQGFFDSSIRACNRRILFTSVAPNETMTAQVNYFNFFENFFIIL